MEKLTYASLNTPSSSVKMITIVKVHQGAGSRQREQLTGCGLELNCTSVVCKPVRKLGASPQKVPITVANSKRRKVHKSTYCRTGFDSDGLTAVKIAMKNDRYHWNSLQKSHPLYLVQELSSHLLDRHHFDFLMILKETLKFMFLSNLVLQKPTHTNPHLHMQHNPAGPAHSNIHVYNIHV